MSHDIEVKRCVSNYGCRRHKVELWCRCPLSSQKWRRRVPIGSLQFPSNIDEDSPLRRPASIYPSWTVAPCKWRQAICLGERGSGRQLNASFARHINSTGRPTLQNKRVVQASKWALQWLTWSVQWTQRRSDKAWQLGRDHSFLSYYNIIIACHAWPTSRITFSDSWM